MPQGDSKFPASSVYRTIEVHEQGKALLPSAPEQVENIEEKVKDKSNGMKKEIVIISSEAEGKGCAGEAV